LTRNKAGLFIPAGCCKENLMTAKNKPLPAQPQENAANKGVAAELSDRAIHNLAGFFDVLIQMDFAQKQRNEQRNENDDFLQGATNSTQQID
jgi:cytochrome c553